MFDCSQILLVVAERSPIAMENLVPFKAVKKLSLYLYFSFPLQEKFCDCRWVSEGSTFAITAVSILKGRLAQGR